MIATERMDYILQKLEAETTVTIKEIAASLNVSEATIRRDFERLEAKRPGTESACRQQPKPAGSPWEMLHR